MHTCHMTTPPMNTVLVTMGDDMWRQEVELAKQTMRDASKVVWDEYMREMQIWDATLRDGLD
jgi:hypothetical protein